MNKRLKMSDDDKWEAVVSCDKNADGLFFYGVKTTGIFCRPSCGARTPSRENVIFFDNMQNAVNAGFRPCKKCRPDMEVFEPDMELLGKARSIFDVDYAKTVAIGNTAKQLGISSVHLARLFKKHCGITPAQYIAGLRVDKAAELLRQTEIGIVEIAYMTGFKSLSNFYKCFKDRTGHTPKDYREHGGI